MRFGASRKNFLFSYLVHLPNVAQLKVSPLSILPDWSFELIMLLVEGNGGSLKIEYSDEGQQRIESKKGGGGENN
jgi:hypothetical protein